MEAMTIMQYAPIPVGIPETDIWHYISTNLKVEIDISTQIRERGDHIAHSLDFQLKMKIYQRNVGIITNECFASPCFRRITSHQRF